MQFEYFPDTFLDFTKLIKVMQITKNIPNKSPFIITSFDIICTI